MKIKLKILLIDIHNPLCASPIHCGVDVNYHEYLHLHPILGTH